MLILHDGNPLANIRHPWVNYALIATMGMAFASQLSRAIRWQDCAFFPMQLPPGTRPIPWTFRVVVGFTILVNIAMAYDVTLLTGSTPGAEARIVAWWAHIGGFAARLVLVPPLKARTVTLFEPAPLTQGAGMRWLGRLIPSLSRPGDRPFGEGAAAVLAAAEHPTRAKALVFAKALLYILLILVLMRFLR